MLRSAHGKTRYLVSFRFASISMTHILFGLLVFLSAALPASAQETAAQPVRALKFDNHEWVGDLTTFVEKRNIRILVPYSRTLFFIDNGHERGITAEVAREFERFLNKKLGKTLGKRPITVFLIPTARDKLISAVAEGKGDIAAGNITITEQRAALLDFVPTDTKTVKEVMVLSPNARPLSVLTDLAGRTVHVRPSTSYAESLAALSAKFEAQGLAGIEIKSLPDAIEDEDKLEMVNAGLLEYAVVDDWIAKIWKQVLPKLQVREDLVLRDDGRTGWGFRKESPEIKALLEEFFNSHLLKSGSIALRIASFHRKIRGITNNTSLAEQQRFNAIIDLFRRYGARYRFDPLMLAAQGFQESRLRQDARSHVGAIGIMQIMPATGQELQVGDIKYEEPNIHAGTKYMDQLMSRYFADVQFSDDERPLFAFASYNAGPGRIAKLRVEAQKRGLDANRWFNNVELVVAEKVGIETTTYVRNIFKYYVAYKLIETEAQERKALLEKNRSL
jgi:membrane-bound lytic murein transglycosylase MltF